jgi:hypothetical protein
LNFRPLVPFLFIFVSGISDQAFSQNPDSSNTRKRNKTVKIFAVPTLGSAPETGFYFGAVALFDIIPRGDSLARHSVIKTELSYTLKKQFIANLEWTLTDKEKKWILFGNNSWTKFPELFWGIGGDLPRTNDVLYSANRLELSNSIYRKTNSNWYLGICQRFQYIYNLEFPDYENDNSKIYDQLNSGIASGLGLGLLYDTRSNLLNPKPKEAFLSLQSMGFGKIIGSDYPFFLADLDMRYYQKVTSKSLLAFQFIGQVRTPDAPYRMLGLVGGPMMLRGYYQGRYRDNQLVASQMEYRWLFIKWVGVSAFTAAGNVFNFKNPERAGSIKSAAGLGFRILVDPKENSFMRFDFAMTRDRDTGFYISFGEAF